jgi:hypothetical protein
MRTDLPLAGDQGINCVLKRTATTSSTSRRTRTATAPTTALASPAPLGWARCPVSPRDGSEPVGCVAGAGSPAKCEDLGRRDREYEDGREFFVLDMAEAPVAHEELEGAVPSGGPYRG